MNTKPNGVITNSPVESTDLLADEIYIQDLLVGVGHDSDDEILKYMKVRFACGRCRRYHTLITINSGVDL